MNTIKIFYLPEQINSDIIAWYSWNLVNPLSPDKYTFLKNIYAIKEGYKSGENYFIVAQTDYKPIEDIEKYVKEFQQFDIMFLDLIVSSNKEHSIHKLYCYYITRKFADIVLTAYDKPFTYLPLLFYDIGNFRKNGKVGIYHRCLFVKKEEQVINKLPICEFKQLGEIKECKSNKLLKVKFSSCFDDSSTLKKLYTKNLLGTENFELVDNDEYNYLIVINKPNSSHPIAPAKTIVLQMEPGLEENNWEHIYNRWFDDKTKYCFYLTHDISYNTLEWHINKNIDQLSKLSSKSQNNILSVILSSKYWLKGHKLRIDFLKYFESNSENITIHCYGKENKFNFKNYKGSLPNWNKDDSLIPYKYTFNAESCDNNNYFTEKIIDAIMSETLIFYWGCPNISKYLDTNAFIILDLNNFEKSKRLIIDSINNNEYEKRLPYIKQQKQIIINRLQIIPRITGLISLDRLKIWVKRERKSKIHCKCK